MQFSSLPLHTVTAECVHAVWYLAIAVLLRQSAYMQFGILPLHTVSADCVDAVMLLHSSCMQFGILALQYSYGKVRTYGDCRVRTCRVPNCMHELCSNLTAVTGYQTECMHSAVTVLPWQDTKLHVHTLQ
jgi:hypothetical protein